MPAINQQRSPAIDTIFGDAEEEILRVDVLVDQMQASFLMCQAFALASLYEA